MNSNNCKKLKLLNRYNHEGKGITELVSIYNIKTSDISSYLTGNSRFSKRGIVCSYPKVAGAELRTSGGT